MTRNDWTLICRGIRKRMYRAVEQGALWKSSQLYDWLTEICGGRLVA